MYCQGGYCFGGLNILLFWRVRHFTVLAGLPNIRSIFSIFYIFLSHHLPIIRSQAGRQYVAVRFKLHICALPGEREGERFFIFLYSTETSIFFNFSNALDMLTKLAAVTSFFGIFSLIVSFVIFLSLWLALCLFLYLSLGGDRPC